MKAITGGKVLVGTGKVYSKGTVLFDEGKIVAVGGSVEIPEGCEIIDAAGKWVTPGFIDAHTHIGTFGNPKVPEMVADGNERSDPLTPELRGIDAVYPYDPAITETRKGGFTTCYTGPGSLNICGGTGFAFKPIPADNVEDMAIPGTEGMKFALGENPKRGYGSKGKAPFTRMANAAIFRSVLTKAKNYSDKLLEAEKDSTKKKPDYDFKLEPLVPVVRGEMKARIHCHRADDIVTAVRIAEEFHLKYSLEHCTEGYMCADYLKKHNVQFILGPMNMGPSKPEIWNARLTTPGKMEAFGFTDFAIMNDTSYETRTLPIWIGLCIARGLSEKMALKCVTVNPAKLLGLYDRLGSLEKGKDADIAVWSGNPFSNFTVCEKTVINGTVYENEVWC